MKARLTMKQRILQGLYPLLMWLQRLTAARNIKHNQKATTPVQPFYNLQAQLINGQPLHFETLRGKKVLLVNTASDCGYTAQYKELQQLQNHFGPELVVIGFPANDFKAQEQKGNEEIAAFCTANFGVQFPLVQKSTVVQSSTQHPVFQWLSNRNHNGWNSQPPVWNFTKYLVNEQGVLTHYFPPAVSPVGHEVIKALNA